MHEYFFDDRNKGEKNNNDNDPTEVLLHRGNVSEEISSHNKERTPEYRTYNIVHKKHPNMA